MSFDAGAIVGKLNLDLSQFGAAITRSAGMASGLPDVGAILANGLTKAVSLAFEFAGAIKGIFLDVASHARQMGSEAEKAGVSVEFLSTVGKVAPGVESLSDALKFLSKNLADATEATQAGQTMAAVFAKIGVSADDLKSTLASNDLEGFFYKTVDGMKALTSNAERTRIAMELFGRGGTELIPTFNKGSEVIKGMAAEIATLGGGVDAGEVKLARGFGKIGKTIDNAWEGIKKAVAEPILEAFGEHTAEITETVKQFAAVLREGVGIAMKTLAPLAAGLWEEFKGIAQVVGAVLGPAFAILIPVLRVVSELMGGILKAVGAVLGGIASVINGVTDAVGLTDSTQRSGGGGGSGGSAGGTKGLGGVNVEQINIQAIDADTASSAIAAKIAPQIREGQRQNQQQIHQAAHGSAVKAAVRGKR